MFRRLRMQLCCLSFDEKSQIQMLGHIHPGVPMKKRPVGTMTHDYKRHR